MAAIIVRTRASRCRGVDTVVESGATCRGALGNAEPSRVTGATEAFTPSASDFRLRQGYGETSPKRFARRRDGAGRRLRALPRSAGRELRELAGPHRVLASS